jgi:hypothetical protein
MENDLRQIPLPVARLIMGFSHNSLSPEQKNILDNWVCESEDNMTIFSDLIADVSDKIFDPYQFISETDEAVELWIIAALITKKKQKETNEVEEEYLSQWVELSERNRSLFEMMEQPAFIAQLISWLKKYWSDRINLN